VSTDGSWYEQGSVPAVRTGVPTKIFSAREPIAGAFALLVSEGRIARSSGNRAKNKETAGTHLPTKKEKLQ
jgi:hypothetical protein